MIQQFTYTASPWGKSGSGWMVFQQSRNVTADAAKMMYDAYQYAESKAARRDGQHPVQFAYLPGPRGQGAVLAQTAFTGVRWWGYPRGGDFFAHVLLLDTEALKRSCMEGCNPVRLYKSKKLQQAFPENLKDKALRIFNKEAAWDEPPELPELQSLSDMPENGELAFNAALDAIPEKIVRQLGALVWAIVCRTTGKSAHPIVFDSGNRFAPLVMSLALDLIPPTWRARTWFAVHFAESAVKRIPGAESLTFYGTDVASSVDSGSGIVSGVDFSSDPFNFCDQNDVRAFKKQLDMLGTEVSDEKYRGLINCRKVSTGKSTDVEDLRSAVEYASAIPGLKDKIGESAAGSFVRYNNDSAPIASKGIYVFFAVAWFELGIRAFADHAKRTASKCVKEAYLLDSVVQELKGDQALAQFLDEVVASARKSGAAAFVNKILDSSILRGNGVPGRAEDDLLQLALEYRDIVAEILSCRVGGGFKIDSVQSREKMEQSLKKMEVLQKLAGPEVRGISDNMKFLEYRHRVMGIRSVKDVAPFLEDFKRGGFPKDANVKKDIISRLEANGKLEAKLTIADLYELGEAFERHGLNGKSFICEKWQQDKWELNRLRQHDKAPSGEAKISSSLSILIALIMGIVIGFIAGSLWGDDVWGAQMMCLKGLSISFGSCR